MVRGSTFVARLALSLLLIAAVAACDNSENGALVAEDTNQGPANYEYLIPAGTGDRIRDGQNVEILPAELTVSVGERIRIVNEDDEGHFVGVFYVGAGETVTQKFVSEGEYTGQCTVHPSGSLTLRITE